MRWNDIGRTLCPIARSLSVVGDRWTLLILRELGMGMHRFEEVQAQTGISSHLLSIRLKRLREEGVIEWRLYSAKPARYEYRVTSKGKELDAVLLALQVWGQKWGGFDPDADPTMTRISKRTGEDLCVAYKVSDCAYEDTVVVISPAYQRERESRGLAFMRARRQARSARK
jgi:DNA-binding HxlR family transcriptional regulator